jgi:hypothetical protein
MLHMHKAYNGWAGRHLRTPGFTVGVEEPRIGWPVCAKLPRIGSLALTLTAVLQRLPLASVQIHDHEKSLLLQPTVIICT